MPLRASCVRKYSSPTTVARIVMVGHFVRFMDTLRAVEAHILEQQDPDNYFGDHDHRTAALRRYDVHRSRGHHHMGREQDLWLRV